jgi:hypothetical protein
MTLPTRRTLALAALGLLLPAAAFAAWPTDTSVNLPLTTAGRVYPAPIGIATDGLGGTVYCWTDGRTDTSLVYVQRLDANGNALWTPNGVVCGRHDTNASGPVVVGAGDGSAIVAWYDLRNGAVADIWAGGASPDGQTLWGARNGVPVVHSLFDKSNLRVVSDGAGGAVYTWSETRTPAPYRTYAQRINAYGQAVWLAGGVPLTSGTGYPVLQIVPDATGGVIVVWGHAVSGPPYYDVYAQRLDGNGAARWGADGITVCAMPQLKWRPGIAASGDGGAIVSWSDARNNGPTQVYAQRFDSLGSALWDAGGMPMALTGHREDPDTLIGDGHGGAFAVWGDDRSNSQVLYGQHLDGNGAPQWTSAGACVDSLGSPYWQTLALDGPGGLLVAWMAGGDIRAQSMTAAGTRRWRDDGVPVSTAPGLQLSPLIVGDGGGGLTATWVDQRAGWPNDNVYAQHVAADGTAGVTPLPPPAALALSPAWPSPARAGSAVTLRAALPAAAHVRLALFDVSGRRVRTLVDTARDAGTFTATWDGRDDAGRAVRAGLYFARLDAAGRHGTTRVAIVD